jgi:arsenite-transporting ATPase
MTQITVPLGHYLREHETLKYFFFGGKGGVGKTVFTAAAAIGLARQGHRTLLVSTNPVHSLSSLFGRDMLGKHVAIEGVSNLWAYEIDTRQSIERSKVEIREKISEVRRHHHQGRRFRRVGDDESRIRRVGDVREHDRSHVQE